MNKIVSISILTLLLANAVNGQDSFTLSGRISDKSSGEDLIGATIIIKPVLSGAVSNQYGFYSISVPEGEYTLEYRFVGYSTNTMEIKLNSDRHIDIELEPSNIKIDEVVISAYGDDRNIRVAEMGVERLNVKQLDLIPVLMGEKDILKTLQLLPGISTASEGSTGFSVRGGSIDQNLIQLDEATVYGASHLAGFFSVFNSDVIKDITVYKGGVPARYGGRASSVVDITMNNGNNKNMSGSGGIGLLSTRFALEGPIIKDRASFIVSARRSYADIILRALPERIINIEEGTRLFFYDLNAKLNFIINDRNRIYLSSYGGRDVFGFEEFGMDWGNYTSTLRWNHLFSDKIFSNTSLLFSNFSYGFKLSEAIRYNSGIKDYGFKEDLSYYLNTSNTLKAGAEIHYRSFNPGELTADNNEDFEIILEEKEAIEIGAYILNENDISESFSANYGFRVSAFTQITGSTSHKTYINPEPRISLNYIFNNLNSTKISYNRLSQYLHLLSNSTSGQVTDIWIPSSDNLKPVTSDQVAAGYFRNFSNNMFETSVEAYYKWMHNITDFEDGTDMLLNENIEDHILEGKGRSAGFEFYVKKREGKFTGWISYTLSKTDNLIEGINDNKWYPAKYDKTHDISVVGSYAIAKRIGVSAVFVYATGNAVTFPSGKYYLDGILIPYFTERNGYRMPAYHRLDLSLQINGKTERKIKTSWDFSVYNAYNRHNAYSIYFRENETNPSVTEAVKLSLFGIVPSITFNIKF